MSKHENGPEPAMGTWVYAATHLCPSRLLFQRTSEGWKDLHGCKERWEDLVEPIDTLPPVAD